MIRKARASAYGMSVTGSRYRAGLWVTGQTSRAGRLGLTWANCGKAASNASSSLKVMKVREQRDPAADAAVQEEEAERGVS